MKASLSQTYTHLPLAISAWTQPTEKITFLLQGSEPTLDTTLLEICKQLFLLYLFNYLFVCLFTGSVGWNVGS